mmetsp:Transcript_109092/g.352158  ORF Transcript_109092/g.352158 Transcript_109092/m.352158 type:complete len:228 (-) Transcript_109092:515-1198(-)
MQLASSSPHTPPPVRHAPAMMCARSPVGMAGPLVILKSSACISPEPTMSPRVILGAAVMNQDCNVRCLPRGWYEKLIWSHRKTSNLPFSTGSFTVSILRSSLGWSVTVPPSLSMRYMQQSFRRLRNWMCFSMMSSSSMSSSLIGSGVSALPSRSLEKGIHTMPSVRPTEWKFMLSQDMGPMTANRLDRSMSYCSSSELGAGRSCTSTSVRTSNGLMCETFPLPLRPR